MSLPLTDDEGRIYAVNNGTPVTFNAGIGYDAQGRMCYTNVPGGSDVWVGGKRVDPVGEVVCGNGTPAARPYVFNAGLPFNKNDGALIRQVDTNPAPTDPFVAGVRVGPLGGVYMTTDAIP